jgi:apolipoprotein N-acyltransferase
MTERQANSVALAVSSLSGAALAFAFPEPDLAPLAWIAIAPFLFVARGTGAKRGAALGAAFGLGFFGVLLIWIKYVGWIAWVLLVILQTVFAAVFGATWGATTRRWTGLWTALLAAAFWVALEFLRSALPVLGFPWGQLAQSQHNVGWILRPAAIGGAWLVSFIVVIVNALLADAYLRLRAGRRREVAVIVLAAAVILGSSAMVPARSALGPSLRVAIIQGNVPRTFFATFFEKNVEILNSHLEETRSLAGADVDLVVWPESSVAIDLRPGNDVAEAVGNAARTANAPIIAGGNLEEGSELYKVVTFHIDENGELVDTYQKTHLVPFGEYVPWPSLRRFVPMLAQIPRDAIAGPEGKTFALDQGRVAPVISFEGDFGSLVRERVGPLGGRLLVVATNTSTWATSWASAQHVAFSQVRAVENGVWVVHAALSGISAFVAPDGSVTERSGLWTRDTLIQTVRMAQAASFYARTGDWLPWACVVVLFVGPAMAARRRSSVT